MSPGLVPNTLGVACMADDVRRVTSQSALADCIGEADARETPVTVLGGGSNLVLRSRLPGMAVLLGIRGLAVERLAEQRWRVTAGAGEVWQEVVTATLGRGIGGLENLTLIPGAVGPAPVQNIGAYGRELADVLESVTVFDRRRGTLETLSAARCGFGYRRSLFKDEPGYVIVGVSMLLGDLALATGYPDVERELRRMGVRPSHLAVAEAVARVRRRKLPDPQRIGNVGSFFKNPFLTPSQFDGLRGRLAIDGFAADGLVKVSAARLIDAAGWKGVRSGAVQVWPHQPLVLVNHGGATAAAVLDMARRICDDVYRKFSVALQLEPSVLGTD